MRMSVDAGAQNSAGVGVGVGDDWTANIGFEGEIAYLFDVAGDTDVVDWSITNVSGNFLYHFDVRHNITRVRDVRYRLRALEHRPRPGSTRTLFRLRQPRSRSTSGAE